MKTTMHHLMAAMMVMAMVVMGATAQSASCGQGLFSDASGCCPMAIAGGVFYRDARGCYPTLTSVGVLYADSNGCYPNANGIYAVQGATCTNPCQVQCLNTTTPANATASPSPSPAANATASPAANATASPAANATASPAANATASPAANATASPAANATASPAANATASPAANATASPSATPLVGGPQANVTANLTTCESLNRSPLPCDTPMQPFEMMLLALRPLQLNCNCNGTTALPNQQPPSAPSANATAADNETMAANATSANDTAANATSANATTADNETMAADATTFQASAQAQGQALTIEKICGATCSANLCNDTCLRILNFALSLELLDSRFFEEGLNNFTAEDFEEAGFPNTTLDFITRIRDNELAHASALQSAIGSLGGTPVEQCNYSFPISNVTQFVEIAQRLENAGVSAYDGTLAFLSSPQLQTTGATIASVEARHAAYLNLLRGMIPFPDALDTPLPISTVLGITDAYVVSCPDQASQQTLEILRSLDTATPANATQS